jgi:dTDP-4-dehydrorhamnose reductase
MAKFTSRDSAPETSRYASSAFSDEGASDLALWGGVECSVVRVGDRYRDQAVETGHIARLDDLDRIAALGLRTLRYPVLWETVAPDDPATCDWRRSDERLARLREQGVTVIAGLVHHGSGPLYTNLLDPDFPEKLADFARRAAARYPWIEAWTPINEPLTTARFSCLYGHWYPHRKSEPEFLQATVIQCLAVARAMAAIREVTPHARLIQTEDMGRIFARPPLAAQARYENERRWLSLDLLTGRVDQDHGWRRRLLDYGVDETALGVLATGLGRPDLIGINHYLTSDRFLDHRTALYPDLAAGGNGRDVYVDVEAVRTPELDGTGPESRLREVWQRYRLPMAVTEAHNSCTREEQLRWLMEVWSAARTLRAEGADLRAVTVWSIFGAVDWASLLTRVEGRFEPGLFDFRSTPPRRTMAAKAVQSLATTGDFRHPVLADSGWWRRDDRFLHAADGAPSALGARSAAQPILITGATGTLGRAFARICARRGLRHVVTSRQQLDIAEPDSVMRGLADHDPWAVINAAGFVRVPEAENARAGCFRENADGAALLAEACAARQLPFATFSSDLVFDGRAGRGYLESDPPCPKTVYGESKCAAETRIAAVCHSALVIRTSAFFGPWDRHNFVWHALNKAARGETVYAVDSQIVSPTYVPDLVNATLDLLLDGESGVWHVANRGAISWFALARAALLRAGLDPALVAAADAAPSQHRLDSERAQLLPAFEDALERYFREIEVPWTA